MLEEHLTNVIGVFDKPAQAAAAVHALLASGFTRKQVSLVAREWAKELDGVRVDLQHAAEDGAVVGALSGGAAGVVAGVAGAALLPVAGPVVAGTLLVGALVGGAAGAAAGTFAGPFVAMGLEEADAKRHAQHLEKGNTVVVVHVKDKEQADRARALMVANGAFDESMANR
jgi:outer membrane lipoprotein SlyB